MKVSVLQPRTGESANVVSALRSGEALIRIKPITVAVAVLIILGCGTFGYLQFLHIRPVIPATVRAKAAYGLLVPNGSRYFKVDKATIKYNDAAKMMSYTVVAKDGSKAAVNQQAAPRDIAEGSSGFRNFVSSLQPYGQIDSAYGKVVLTSPQQLNGAQIAVLNAKGTIVFVRAATTMTDNQWRQIFDGLRFDE